MHGVGFRGVLFRCGFGGVNVSPSVQEGNGMEEWTNGCGRERCA